MNEDRSVRTRTSDLDNAQLVDWLRQQAVITYDTYRADPSRGLSLEEVRASLGKR